MLKAYIVASDSRPSYYRLVINVTDEYSVGTILSRAELAQLLSSIQNILDSDKETVVGDSQ